MSRASVNTQFTANDGIAHIDDVIGDMKGDHRSRYMVSERSIITRKLTSGVADMIIDFYGRDLTNVTPETPASIGRLLMKQPSGSTAGEFSILLNDGTGSNTSDLQEVFKVTTAGGVILGGQGAGDVLIGNGDIRLQAGIPPSSLTKRIFLETAETEGYKTRLIVDDSGKIGIGDSVGTLEPTHQLHVVGDTNITTNLLVGGNATITGDLTVLGETFSIETTAVQTSDKNLNLAFDATTVGSIDAGGVTLGNVTVGEKTIMYDNTTGRWDFNIDVNVDSGLALRVNDTDAILSNDLLSFSNSASSLAWDGDAMVIEPKLKVQGPSVLEGQVDIDIPSGTTISRVDALGLHLYSNSIYFGPSDQVRMRWVTEDSNEQFYIEMWDAASTSYVPVQIFDPPQA